MANFNVEGAQNVEISKKIPCEKPLIVQLEIDHGAVYGSP